MLWCRAGRGHRRWKKGYEHLSQIELGWGFHCLSPCTGASQLVLVVKNPPASAGGIRDEGSIPGSGKIPWRRSWQPTPVFSFGKPHGQRSLVGYSPWVTELDTSERLSTSLHSLSSTQQLIWLRSRMTMPPPCSGPLLFLELNLNSDQH